MKVVVCALMVLSVAEALNIAAFNIKRLSENTLNSHAGRLQSLVTILRRYDIISVEEVMDAYGLADVVKSMNSHGGGPYAMIKSAKTGRTSYKEYYAFVYRTDRVQVRGSYQYHDVHDWFEREPFSALFHAPSSQLSDFVIAACHLKPDQAKPEIGHLVDVYTDISNHYNNKNVMFDGDFNADCSYLSTSALLQSPLYQDHRFQWLLSSSVDTTASHHTNCAYDRFVVAGAEFQAAVVPGSATVYNFETALHLTFTQAYSVSDHYPIEMKLKSA
ncbi:deoxyribonuclease-1-like [Haliotis rufescens]|uniref:deoxyribonuclease-1-like n=1 Tax=Haliotis rufescens TaxID=6454 RepID=UPI001EB089B1|nr:deoxyribonuclease-1-like [Haliotis rufescens]